MINELPELRRFLEQIEFDLAGSRDRRAVQEVARLVMLRSDCLKAIGRLTVGKIAERLAGEPDCL